VDFNPCQPGNPGFTRLAGRNDREGIAKTRHTRCVIAGQLSRRGKRGQQQGDSTMQADVLFRILKGVSWAVIALMLISIAYATFTSIKYWAGIGV